MNKADKDKVIAALEINRVMAADADGNYTREVTPKAITEALTIMRGLAEDAEPVARVAEVHMSRYTLEWLNGPLPEGTELYTSPQAAQTEAQEREEFEAEFDQLCKDYSIYGTMEARLCKVFFEAGRAGRKV